MSREIEEDDRVPRRRLNKQQATRLSGSTYSLLARRNSVSVLRRKAIELAEYAIPPYEFCIPMIES
jgi:hypothetical protein